MQKINFQDLPNTTTPVNAANLNLLQTNVEAALPTPGISYGTISNKQIPTGNDGENVGTITLTPGIYIIHGVLNGFPTNAGKWIQISNITAGNVVSMVNLDNIYGGEVIGIVKITQTSTFALRIIQYTGSTMTYTKHWADVFTAIKID